PARGEPAHQPLVAYARARGEGAVSVALITDIPSPRPAATRHETRPRSGNKPAARKAHRPEEIRWTAISPARDVSALTGEPPSPGFSESPEVASAPRADGSIRRAGPPAAGRPGNRTAPARPPRRSLTPGRGTGGAPPPRPRLPA